MSHFPAALPLILPVVQQHGHLFVHALVTLPATLSFRLIINSILRSVYCLLPDGSWPLVEMLESLLNKWSGIMRRCHVSSTGATPSVIWAARVCTWRVPAAASGWWVPGRSPRTAFVFAFSLILPHSAVGLARLSNYVFWNERKVLYTVHEAWAGRCLGSILPFFWSVIASYG